MSLAAILALGFFLGMRHATDADHVVAVSAIVSRERTLRAAAPVGIAWGLGHTATILLVGGLIVLFGVVITPRVGLGMELSVALMLVLLGAINLKSSSLRPSHEHPPHGEAVGYVYRWFRRSGGYRLLRPLIVGVVHGLAGSAAVALLVLATVRDPLTAIAYLLVFGLGTIAGMFLITTALATPIVLTVSRFQHAHRLVGVAAGLLSVGLGVYVAYDVTFVHGLFGSNPQWTAQ